MKYTIEGFRQDEILKLGNLDIVDLVILRWIVDFEPIMAKKEIDNEIYFWVSYQSLLQALPILTFGEKTLYRRLEKMCTLKILKHQNRKEKDNFPYYTFGEKYQNLVSKIPEQDNFSMINYNLLNNSSNHHATSEWKSKEAEDLFIKFWNCYPRKVSKGNAEKWFKRNCPTKELVDEMVNKLSILKCTKQWKERDGQFIPYPSTWLNAKGWEDEVNQKDLVETEESEIARLTAEIERRKANGEWH